MAAENGIPPLYEESLIGKSDGRLWKPIRVDCADHTLVTSGQPIRLRGAPEAKIGTAYEINVRIFKPCRGGVDPIRMDLLIIVNDSDQVAFACGDSTIHGK